MADNVTFRVMKGKWDFIKNHHHVFIMKSKTRSHEVF